MSCLAYDYVMFYSVLGEMKNFRSRRCAGRRYIRFGEENGVAECSSTAAEEGKYRNEWTRRMGIKTDFMRWYIVHN